MRRAKLFLALLGFLLAAVGVALENQPLVWVAMAVLAAALMLRLWLRRKADSQPPASDDSPTA
jgi:Flp pilus assembly protein TadB